MATIGVTRGLGDHDLKVYNSNIHIKPFLSCCPEVSGTCLKSKRRLTHTASFSAALIVSDAQGVASVL